MDRYEGELAALLNNNATFRAFLKEKQNCVCRHRGRKNRLGSPHTFDNTKLFLMNSIQ